MVIIITGASHTGKTALAQKMLETYHYPYLSVDHLKMGLIRSGDTDLTPFSADSELTAYLWPIVREIIRTALENGQNLTVEGCYIPLLWAEDFSEHELTQIRCFCLVMSRNYIMQHFQDIRQYASVIEQRLDDSDCTQESVLADNAEMKAFAALPHVRRILIDERYDVRIEL